MLVFFITQYEGKKEMDYAVFNYSTLYLGNLMLITVSGVFCISFSFLLR